jgi:hypothetical protein
MDLRDTHFAKVADPLVEEGFRQLDEMEIRARAQAIASATTDELCAALAKAALDGRTDLDRIQLGVISEALKLESSPSRLARALKIGRSTLYRKFGQIISIK